MSTASMSPARLVVRCVAERRGNQWQAFSLEFGLAAQGSSFPEAKAKLDSMIVDYVYDALVGEDREHAAELLDRSSPWWVYAKYHYASLMHRFRPRFGKIKTFLEPLRLEPIPNHC